MLEIEEYYGIDSVQELDLWEREYNIPPTEVAPIIFDHKGSRHLVQGSWSLVSAVTPMLEGSRRISTFNAKSETLAVKPLFKVPFLKRRCVVPADAFYEWVGTKGRRQPLSIGRTDGKRLSMAGLFSYWKPKDSEGLPIATFTIITTAPNQWMARIHNRMLPILQDDQIDQWLDTTASDPHPLIELLKAPPEDFLSCYPVSRKMSSGRADDPAFASGIEVDYSALLKN
jgi:putative SOS response-associated peptidase YedK